MGEYRHWDRQGGRIPAKRRSSESVCLGARSAFAAVPNEGAVPGGGAVAFDFDQHSRRRPALVLLNARLRS
jgi:hypothetical protein